MRLPRVTFHAAALLLFAAIFAVQPRKATAQTIHDGDTLRVEDCEDNHGSPHGCGTWVFTGSHGHGYWPDGTSANLELEVFTDNEIRVSRTDTEGLQKGIKAVYTGVRTGDHIEGTVSWTWPRHIWPLAKGTIAFKGTIQSYVPAPVTPSTNKISPGAAVLTSGSQNTQNSGPICYRFTGSPTKTGGTRPIPVVIDVRMDKIPDPHLEQGMRRYMFDKSGMTAQAGSVNGSATVRFDGVTEFDFLSVDIRSDTGGTLLEIKGNHLIPDAHATPVRTFRISLKSVGNLLPDGLVPTLPSSDKWVTNSAVPPGELYLDMPDDYVTGSISYAGSCAASSCPPEGQPLSNQGKNIAFANASDKCTRARMRVQLQRNTDDATMKGDNAADADDPPGVAKLDLWALVETIPERAKSWKPEFPDRLQPQLEKAVASLRVKIYNATMYCGYKKNLFQEIITDPKKRADFRIDIDNLAGCNLRQ